jgi:hypothetical protein
VAERAGFERPFGVLSIARKMLSNQQFAVRYHGRPVSQNVSERVETSTKSSMHY